MADTVKNRKCKEIISVGNRVSIERTYFDRGDDKYSEDLPTCISRIMGTIIYVFPTTNKASIKWDIDNTTSTVLEANLMLEDENTILQNVTYEDNDSDKENEIKESAESENERDILFVHIKVPPRKVKNLLKL